MFMHGFTCNNKRLVFHAIDEPNRLQHWETALNDIRYKPGFTRIVGYLDGNSLGNIASAADIVKLFVKRPPLYVAVVVYDRFMINSINDGTSFLRAAGINAKSFSDLDRMFKWIDKQEKIIDKGGG